MDGWELFTHVRLSVSRGDKRIYDRACVMPEMDSPEMRWWAVNQLCQEAVKTWTTHGNPNQT